MWFPLYLPPVDGSNFGVKISFSEVLKMVVMVLVLVWSFGLLPLDIWKLTHSLSMSIEKVFYFTSSPNELFFAFTLSTSSSSSMSGDLSTHGHVWFFIRQ
jgi:hypothetical protein